MPQLEPTHGGAIVLRNAGAPEVLLVRAKPAPHDWILPKGHIKRGETPEDTARREVAEEAGVDAKPLRYVGMLEFDSPKSGHVRAAYFLMRYVREVPRDEQRELRWCGMNEAMTLVRFADTRGLIAAAVLLFRDDATDATS